MSSEGDKIELEVLISTFGREGIERICRSKHPRVAGVRWLVSWQLPDGDCPIPPKLAARDDFKIIKHATRGLSVNRNRALAEASAPLLLIADDDLFYRPEELEHVIDMFRLNPQADILTFRFRCSNATKNYPSRSFDLSRPPRGYYVSSVEIALRRAAIIGSGVRFNEAFGVGARFIAGEEDIFIHDALKSGLRGRFIPLTICTHPDITTSTKLAKDPKRIETLGAVHRLIHPGSWPLRMIVHSLRQSGKGETFSRKDYLRAWLRGSREAAKL